MIPEKSLRWMSILVFLIGIMIAACASQKFLKVHYSLPSQSEVLAGRTVSLSLNDMRENSKFLTPSAQKRLKAFSETFSLVVSRENNPGNLLGAFDVSSLFKEILKQKLENAGASVVQKTDPADAEIGVVLKQFMLDLQKRKWILTLNYQTNIIKDQRIASTQAFSGSAERLGVVGSGDAEKVISNLLTEMINKLDLEKLFQDAGL
jgi:uncharacterized lipoprotein YajG